MYQQLDQLNAFDQRLTTSFHQVLSRRLAFVSRNSLSRSPSTDTVNVPGVVFRRQGVTMDEYRGGLESRLGRHTTLTSLYVFEWLKYDDNGVPSPVQISNAADIHMVPSCSWTTRSTPAGQSAASTRCATRPFRTPVTSTSRRQWAPSAFGSTSGSPSRAGSAMPGSRQRLVIRDKARRRSASTWIAAAHD